MALPMGNWGRRSPRSGVIILFITGRVPPLYNLELFSALGDVFLRLSLKHVSSQLVVQDIDFAVLSLKSKYQVGLLNGGFFLHIFLRRSTPKTSGCMIPNRLYGCFQK